MDRVDEKKDAVVPEKTGRVATWEELKKARDLVFGWLNGMQYFHYSAEDCSYIDTDNGRITFKLFTDRNKYAISVVPPVDDYLGHLGCVGDSRKPRAGETWTRGNDLPDGPMTRGTFDKIIRAIVGYELVDIKYPVSKSVEEEGARRANKETVSV